MKVLFASQVPDSRLMGVPRVLYAIGDELEQHGHTVQYFYEDDGPAPILKQAALMDWAVRAAPRIAARARREDADVIVATTLSGWFLSTFRRGLLPEKTRIVSWHHGWEELMWEQMLAEEKFGGHRFSARFKWYYGNVILWANRQALRTQDAAFFTSTEERDWVRAHYPEAAHKAVYLPNGVSAKYYYPERWEKAPVEGPPRLLFVGYWDPWRKGRKYLAAAYGQLRRKYPDLTLTLAGTKLGPEDILPDFPHNVHDGITIVPHMNEEEAIRLYREHDIFLLPSLFEGMPLVVLEAMAAAMPVVTTACTGMKDLITHNQNGLLVPRRDVSALVNAVGHLVESPGLRKQLGFSAFHTVSTHFTWGQVAEICEETLMQVVNKRL